MLHVIREPYNITGNLSCAGNTNVIEDHSKYLAPLGSDTITRCERLDTKGLKILKFTAL